MARRNGYVKLLSLENQFQGVVIDKMADPFFNFLPFSSDGDAQWIGFVKES